MGCNYQPQLVSERRISEASTLYEMRKHQESETDNDGRTPQITDQPFDQRSEDIPVFYFGMDIT